MGSQSVPRIPSVLAPLCLPGAPVAHTGRWTFSAARFFVSFCLTYPSIAVLHEDSVGDIATTGTLGITPTCGLSLSYAR